MANITPKCWNCGSTEKWTEVISYEQCNNCGIACFYHGSGANDAYKEAMEAKYAREAITEEDGDRHARLMEEAERDRRAMGDRYLNESEYY